MAFPYTSAAVMTVYTGRTIPAHDETLDLAESIGQKLDEFRSYVASVRDPEQARLAVLELLAAFVSESAPE